MNLFPSTLVINPSKPDIISLLATVGHTTITNNPDIFELTEYSIATVRQINKFLSQKPISHSTKVVLIINADLLLHEAQNALLKILEEPGLDNYFILTSDKPNSLLPTIISRCRVIRFNSSKSNSDKVLVIPQSIAEKLILSETLASDKVSTLAYLENQLHLYHQKLIDQPTADNQKIITSLIKSISLVKANVDPKTAIDFLLLS